MYIRSYLTLLCRLQHRLEICNMSKLGTLCLVVSEMTQNTAFPLQQI